MIPGDPRRNDPGQELFPGRCELLVNGQVLELQTNE